ncbi:hypothetical protein F503_06733 [Ophiostoma piceae UAMH 11346]|uniref:Uncharacterized protein n=1 Tax=Ophiostoma piceae (strain UAMH 11346) TaxID=1262450 RepID=S3CSB8_OPHP1|nr:hypothetical protein F503_06733 [Ophiostoma piceae UAMH 11346]
MGEVLYALMAHSKEPLPLDSRGSYMGAGSMPQTRKPAADIEPRIIDADPRPKQAVAEALYDTSSDSDSDSDTATLLLSDTNSSTDALTLVSSSSSSSSSSSAEPSPPAKTRPFPFLRLPLEIRLQIYHWTVRLGICSPAQTSRSPSREQSDAKSTSAQPPRTYANAAAQTAAQAAAVAVAMQPESSLFYHCIPMYFGNNQWGGIAMGVFSSTIQQAPVEYRAISERQNSNPRLLPAYRPVGKSAPSSLLQASRQIYSEARTAAYETSEFVFVRIFSSALSTAASFVGVDAAGSPATLLPYQRRAIRHVRMELDVSVRDIGWTGRGYAPDKATSILEGGKWAGLCAGLAGLQNLRLLLNVTEDRMDSTGRIALQESPFLDGLLRLKSIRQVEIELVWTQRGRFRSRAANMDDADLTAGLDWCAAIQQRLQEQIQQRRVRVVNVERI